MHECVESLTVGAANVDDVGDQNVAISLDCKSIASNSITLQKKIYDANISRSSKNLFAIQTQTHDYLHYQRNYRYQS